MYFLATSHPMASIGKAPVIRRREGKKKKNLSLRTKGVISQHVWSG
jgi:hypothetical protein